MTNNILIIGATGKQGWAVINSLLSSPEASKINSFAFTRNTDSAAAKDLVAKSPKHISLVQGDLNDCEAIFASVAKRIKGVFCISVPALGPGAKSEREEVQGKALIDASLQHGVEHFVFASADRHGTDSDSIVTDVPHYIRKAKIEKYLREECAETRMTWTVLRPVVFMEDIDLGFAGKICQPLGRWDCPQPRSCSSLQLQISGTLVPRHCFDLRNSVDVQSVLLVTS
jgi:uncharacterized protein YbjT (DUF2867 family)